MHEQDVCDVCGRTLLRGEHTEAFVDGGRRRYDVCELCKPHALHEGWLREGAEPDYPDTGSAPSRRGSLFGRFRRSAETEGGRQRGPRSLDDELSGGAWAADPEPEFEALPDPPPAAVPGPSVAEPRRRRGRRAPEPEPSGAGDPAAMSRVREPRHVHAIPTSGDHKIAAAADAFNHSQYCRTIAGVARSLGAPAIAILPDSDRASLVWLIASWELCWYRYEIDLSAEGSSVRLDGQGYELDELSEPEQIANAAADDVGRVYVG